jgi:hypothetical protein
MLVGGLHVLSAIMAAINVSRRIASVSTFCPPMPNIFVIIPLDSRTMQEDGECQMPTHSHIVGRAK